jgi:hypothetical protein
MGLSNIYIDSSPEKIERTESYLYLKFESAGFSISSTKKYPELMFNTGEKKLSFECLILKKEGKDLIILKYPMDKSRESNDDFISLLEMIPLHSP